jgi:hypothetical protein
MTVSLITNGPQAGWMKVYVVGNATAVANQLGQILNPEGVQLQITDGFMHVINDADSAATLDIGIGASGADETDIISGYDINGVAAGAVVALIGKDLASEGAATTPKGILWGAAEYMSFYNPAAYECATFEAYCYFRYIRVGDDVTRL